MHTLRYDAGAGAYDRLTGRWSRMYVDAVLKAAAVGRGSYVLDVAAGTGDAAIAAADRVEPGGMVVATDISVPMLQEAVTKANGRRIAYVVADAQRLPCRIGSFDAIVCLFGVMFLPKQVEALRGFRRRPVSPTSRSSWRRGHRPSRPSMETSGSPSKPVVVDSGRRTLV